MNQLTFFLNTKVSSFKAFLLLMLCCAVRLTGSDCFYFAFTSQTYNPFKRTTSSKTYCLFSVLSLLKKTFKRYFRQVSFKIKRKMLLLVYLNPFLLILLRKTFSRHFYLYSWFNKTGITPVSWQLQAKLSYVKGNDNSI